MKKILSFVEKPVLLKNKVVFEGVINNLKNYQGITNNEDMQCFLEEIEFLYGKNGIWTLMIMDLTEKLEKHRSSFEIDKFMESINQLDLYTKMNRMQKKLQELDCNILKN